MKFTPADNYKDLKIQACALASLVTSMEKEITIYDRLLREERAKKRHVSQDELDSERAANSILTEELERLRRRDPRDFLTDDAIEFLKEKAHGSHRPEHPPPL